MKVLYVIPGLSGSGGAERSLASMAPFLCRRVELHIATFTGRSHLAGELEAAGASVVDLPALGRFDLVRRIDDLIGELKPDLVHSTLLDADIAARIASARCRTPVVSSLVNVNYGREQFRGGFVPRSKKTAVWLLDAASARLVVRFHALSDHVASTMSRRLSIAERRIEVIPRGRDPRQLGVRSQQRRDEARRSLGLGDEPVVVAAARHETQKGLDVLLRAVELLARFEPGVRVIIGGRDGAATPMLRQLVADLRLEDRVRFIGQRDDVSELMCAADVWCVPSRWEGLGGILIEAMALEVPVVASDIAPIAEVGGSPSCFTLVPQEDPGALARGIASVLKDPHASSEKTKRGRGHFLANFTSEDVAVRMASFYETALGDSRLSRRRSRTFIDG